MILNRMQKLCSLQKIKWSTHPSCLIFGYTLSNEVIHIVAGCDEKYVYIITAYYPNIEKFSADLKKRKE